MEGRDGEWLRDCSQEFSSRLSMTADRLPGNAAGIGKCEVLGNGVMQDGILEVLLATLAQLSASCSGMLEKEQCGEGGAGKESENTGRKSWGDVPSVD